MEYLITFGVFACVVALIAYGIHIDSNKVTQHIEKFYEQNGGHKGTFTITTRVYYNGNIVKTYYAKAEFNDPNFDTMAKKDMTTAKLYLKTCRKYGFDSDNKY